MGVSGSLKKDSRGAVRDQASKQTTNRPEDAPAKQTTRTAAQTHQSPNFIKTSCDQSDGWVVVRKVFLLVSERMDGRSPVQGDQLRCT